MASTIVDIYRGDTPPTDTNALWVNTSAYVLQAPSGGSVTAGDAQITLHPGTVSGADSYNGYYTSDGSTPTKASTKLTGVTDNQVVTGLNNGTLYKFGFTALDINGESALSTIVSATPQAAGGDVTAPVVTAFDIPATTNGLTVTISTFTATDAVGVTGYKVTESATPPGAGDAGWSGSAPTTYDVATNGAKTLYGYAKDAAGNVSTGVSDTTTVTTAPNAVTSLDATDGDTESVITWTASAADSTHSAATSYNLRWKLSTDGSYTTVTGVTSPYTKTGLTNGLTYDFIVDAINAAGTTASSGVQATPAAASTFSFPLTFTGTGALDSSLFNVVQPAGLTNASSGSTIDRSSDKLRFHVASNNASFAGQELQFRAVDPFPISLSTVKTITFDLTYPSQLVESRFIVCPTFPSAGNSFFNESNWMTMIIAPGTLGLNKKVSGVESNVHSASVTWVAGNTYAIKIEVDSTGTTIYVDNVSKISMSYGLTINSAYLAMYYGHTSATFYNLLVDNFNIA